MKTLIYNASILDGSGAPAIRGSVLIEDEKILSVGDLPMEADQLVDAQGLTLAPGFINLHDHLDSAIFDAPDMTHLLQQGVTTNVNGCCGTSIAPITSDEAEVQIRRTYGSGAWPMKWRTYKEFLDAVKEAGSAVHHEFLVGHGALRICVMGFTDRHPTAEEQAQMENLLDECMAAGAKGLSLGLIYAPSCYSETEELIGLCRVVQKYDGVLMVHMRNENDLVLEAEEECFRIVRATGVRLNISHLKTCGERNTPKAAQLLEGIDKMREAGYDVTFDQYPFTASSTGLRAMVPTWAFDGGFDAFPETAADPENRRKILEGIDKQFVNRTGPENIIVTLIEGMHGKSIREISEMLNLPPNETILKLMLDNRCHVSCIYHMMSEESVETIMKHPMHAVGTDGSSFRHPRRMASFTRFLGHYVREKGLVPLPEAIRRITSEAARRVRLNDRGFIRPGYTADLVLFNPDTIVDRATYTESTVYGVGVKTVWVSGKVAFEGPVE